MWFKQLSFYPIVPGKCPDPAALQSHLSELAFSPCLRSDWCSEGFVPPIQGRPDEMVLAVKNSIRAVLKKEEKVLPAGVINDVVAETIREIEQNEGRVVGRKEKQNLKERITDNLLPRAFTRSSQIQALFDTDRNLLLINQAGATKAENMLTKLRQSLGGLEAALPKTERSAGNLMTSWLNQRQAAGNFVLDSDCELKGTGETAAVVRMGKQDLGADEVQVHLESKTVTRLGLIWADKIRFVLNADLTFKRIQFLDVLWEEASNEGEDAETLAAAEQLIVTENLGQMITELIGHLGGLSKE